MKATELMIGDWVKSRTGMNVKIVGINHDSPNDYEHIPLTAEILEKNGWKDKWWWDLPDCPFWLTKYCENSWADGKWGVLFNSEDDSPSFLIGGIHELQHLLRLCGLNELADNFKI